MVGIGFLLEHGGDSATQFDDVFLVAQLMTAFIIVHEVGSGLEVLWNDPFRHFSN
jgi:hypothetical protein